GYVNRADLQRTYGLSAAQVSSDLQRYATLHPRALTYNLRLKRYEGAPAMRPSLHQPRLEEAVELLLRAPGGDTISSWSQHPDSLNSRAAVVHVPHRSAPLDAQRAVFQAVLFGRQLRIRYVSLTSRGESWREIAPHALAHDGYRWHARAWCFENRDY